MWRVAGVCKGCIWATHTLTYLTLDPTKVIMMVVCWCPPPMSSCKIAMGPASG